VGEAPLEDAHVHGGGGAEKRGAGRAEGGRGRGGGREVDVRGARGAGWMQRRAARGGGERVNRRGQCCRGASFGMQGRVGKVWGRYGSDRLRWRSWRRGERYSA